MFCLEKQRSCRCVSGTGRPGTLSNLKTVVDGAVVTNWNTLDQIQKQIQGVVRVQSSEHTMNKAAVHAYDPAYYNANGDIVARQQSDRAGSKGVDIKHNSYARYLNRIKGRGFLKASVAVSDRPTALQGAKTTTFSIVPCPSRICRRK